MYYIIGISTVVAYLYLFIRNRDNIYMNDVCAEMQVRLWTVSGLYIGHFGQSTPWDIDAVFDPSNTHRLLPHDVKKVASSTTLMVGVVQVFLNAANMNR